MLKVDSPTLIRKVIYIYIYIKIIRKIFDKKKKFGLVRLTDPVVRLQVTLRETTLFSVFIKPYRLCFENTNISGHCACIILSKFGLYKDKGLQAECW